MHDIVERRWTRGDGPILEWTLDGDIHYTNGNGSMLRQWTLEVEGDTIDLSEFEYEYADETLRPALEQRGFEVVLPESEDEKSLLGRIKRFILG